MAKGDHFGNFHLSYPPPDVFTKVGFRLRSVHLTRWESIDQLLYHARLCRLLFSESESAMSRTKLRSGDGDEDGERESCSSDDREA